MTRSRTLPSIACAIFLLAGLTVHCSSSDDSSGSAGAGGAGAGGSGSGSGGKSGSAGKSGAAGSSALAGGGATGDAGAAQGGEAGATGAVAGAGGEGGEQVEVTTPVIGTLADVAVVQNTLATPTVPVSFTVTDPGGLTGLTAIASSANEAVAKVGAVTCTNGTCAFDVDVKPADSVTLSITVSVQNPRGGSAKSQFALSVAPRTVTTGTDAGAGSLRAIVNAAAAGDVVVFDPTVTKVSLSSELDFTRAITVNGPGANSLAVDCGNVEQCIGTTGDTVSLSGMAVKNAKVGISALGGHLALQDMTVSNNNFGLEITASSASTIVDATNCAFSSNQNNGVTITSTSSVATGNFTGCTVSSNATGFAIDTSAADQTVHLRLLGGNQVQNNTQNGIVVEMDGGLGTATVEMPPSGGSGTNDVSHNPVGVLRSGAVPASALTIAPATQVQGNTADFSPAWP